MDTAYAFRSWCNGCRTFSDHYHFNGGEAECGTCHDRKEELAKIDTPPYQFSAAELSRMRHFRWAIAKGIYSDEIEYDDAAS